MGAAQPEASQAPVHEGGVEAAQRVALEEVPKAAAQPEALEEVPKRVAQRAVLGEVPKEAVQPEDAGAVQPEALEEVPREAAQRAAWGEDRQGDGYCRVGIEYSRAMPDDIVQKIVQAFFGILSLMIQYNICRNSGRVPERCFFYFEKEFYCDILEL
ncbi:hypothetical protein [Diplocloster agilis]|uniref:hypothetical protein n=1 Tax=Diplocloster agilis TaxID=2850323 RepID=UPI0008232FDE|nr:hypothetical protein [Suonthocola fibrivorans]MCU6736062.1 hypothetical protein [Suonthocola fibrivorans]SCJ85769.1 Uncharacterised protein [uncultured Clostridium sp.]